MVAVMVLLSCLFLYQGEAMAYLDPGSGSYIFQVLVAFFMGSILAVKMFWQNIKAYFSRFFGSKKKDMNGNDK